MDSSKKVGSELTSTGVSATEETFTIAANLQYIAAFMITEGTAATYSY